MKTIAFAAIAGLAAAASAQNFSLTIVPSSTMIDTTSGPVTFTMTVFGDADFGSHLLGGAFAVASSGDSDVVQSMAWTAASWSQFNTDGGDAGNGNYNQVVFGQLVIPGIFPPAPGSELGSAIGSFEVTVDGMGDVEFQLTAGTPFSLETVDSVLGDTMNDGGAISLGSSGVISVVPAPSAMALLGLGGLVAGRRRR
ncbi:MAG: PEP-CTERM sorting domain-containing protein [Phycisphaerales bacterium]